MEDSEKFHISSIEKIHNFYDLPSELQFLLEDAAKKKYITISYESGVRLRSHLLKRHIYEEVYDRLNDTCIDFNEIEGKIILFIMGLLYNPDEMNSINRKRVNYQEIFIYYAQQYGFLKNLNPILGVTTTTVNSVGNNFSEGSKDQKTTFTTGYDVWSDNKKEKKRELKDISNKKDNEIDFYLYQNVRIHGIRIKGEIDPKGILFKSIVENLSLQFNPKSAWAQTIKGSDELFSFRLNKNGKINFGMNHDIKESDLLQSFINTFNFLTDSDLVTLLNSFMDDTDHIYFIEMACAIGPKPIIDQYYRNVNFTLTYRNNEGITKKILMVIDKSKGNWEFEPKGKLKDCSRIIGALTHKLEFITGLENIENKQSNIEKEIIDIKKLLNKLSENNPKNDSKINDTLTKLIQLIEIGQSINNQSIQKFDYLATQNNAILNELKENNAITMELVKNYNKIAYETLIRHSYVDNFSTEIQRFRNFAEVDIQKILNLCYKIAANQDQLKSDLKQEVFENSEEILNNLNYLNEKLTEHSFFDTIHILFAQALNHQKLLQQIKSNEI